MQARNLGLIDQRLHAGEIGLGAFVIGLAGPHVGLGDGDIAAGGLFVRQTGTFEFRHGIGKLRGGARGAGLGGVAGQRDDGLGGMQLALRLHQGSAGDIDPGLVIARIDAHQDVAGLHRLVVLHQHFEHVARDFGGDRGDVRVHLSVVARDAIAEMEPGPYAGRDGQNQHAQGRRT